MHHLRYLSRVLLPLVLVGATLLGSVACQIVTPPPAPPSPAAQTPTRPSATPAQPAPPPSGPAADLGNAVRQVAQAVRPAVVQITNQQTTVDLFNQPYTVPAGVGSGVIYDSQGHILTNNHVVQDAQSLLVSLPDGRSFPARLVGADPQTDLAVLQITADNLPVARLAESNHLQVGDWVVAIGNALGLSGGPTVTSGVVSALGRTVQEPSSGSSSAAGPYLFDLIQTDAAINPGNSGGPLVNLSNEVVGINTLVAGQAEPGVPAQGIGFAISIDTAKPIADQLVATGRAVHPYLGIRYQPLNPAIASQLGIPSAQGGQAPHGVVILQVLAGSPAGNAGLRRGDAIIAIDGNDLKDESSLAQTINQKKPGDSLTLSVLRGNQRLSVQVTLGEAPPA
ncbi:MAG TPA: trypsin-like peptidase domain-containing protein [Chloroflexota bacterium]|nr:trypsin-like peptidase domain-containing protein [Chloroflexota bacterium]